MDPWVDFIGIPKEQEEADGSSYIALVQPKGLHQVEALFMDELNRAPKKVRNAVMELIQFKSINGIPFPNLRFIWAAVNPDDEEDADTSYDVEALDPAQKDRFQIVIDIPYKPSAPYFQQKYGTAGEGAVEWWNKLDAAAKELVSPRRLEYAIKVHAAGGSLRHVLRGPNINPTSLSNLMEIGSIKKRLRELTTATDETCAAAFNDINFVTNSKKSILSNAGYIKAFAQHMPKDIISETLVKQDKNSVLLADNAPAEVVDPVLLSLLESMTKNQQKKFAKTFGHRKIVSDNLDGSVKPVVAGSFEEVTDKAISILTKNGSHNTTHYRKKALEMVRDRYRQAAYDNDNIVIDDAIRVAILLAEVVKRSQVHTVEPFPNLNYAPSMTYMGDIVDELEQIISTIASSVGKTANDVATMAEADIRSAASKRVYTRARRVNWSQLGFDKVYARFSWWY
jgi:hypothetical protein